jgi:peptide/nickel transport system substrate-binding protein
MVVRVLTGLLLGACALVGCGSSGGATAGSPTALTMAVADEPACLDPNISPQDATAWIMRSVYDSLVFQDSRGGIHPWLATSWKISKDLRDYTFRLRSDVRFHDGSVLTAQTVKDTFDRIIDPTTRSLYAATLLGPYSGSSVVDRHTVRVSFRTPDAAFLQSASQTFLGITSSRQRKNSCTRPLGSGAFEVADYLRGDHLTLRRHDGYRWGPVGSAEQARLSRITVRFLPEDAVRVGALTSGDAQIAGTIPPHRIRNLRGRVRLLRTDLPGAAYSLHLNTSRPPFDDVRIRLGFQQAIDADQIVSAIYADQYRPARGPIGPSTPLYDVALNRRTGYDPRSAARLLDQAGYTGRDALGYRTRAGRRLTVVWPFNKQQAREERGIVAQLIQEQARRAGIELRIENMSAGQWLDARDTGDFNVFDRSWTTANPDILRSFYDSGNHPAKGKVGYNAAFVADKDIDTWLRDALATDDESRRRALYDLVQQAVLDRGYLVPIYVPASIVATAREVRGLVLDGQACPLLYRVERVR